MRKNIVILAVILAVLVALAGCTEQEKKTSGTAEKAGTANTAETKTVTATSSFIYDMVKQVAGDKVKIELIVPAGLDPHTYIAKPADVDKINNADLVLYHGLNFEGKMVEILTKKGVAVSKNFDPADLIGDADSEIDPHFWFDLKLYKMAIDVVGEELAKLLPDDKAAMEKNTAEYKEKLDELQKDLDKKMEELPKEKRFLITPHDAFSYLARIYEIEVHAPQGISTDSEVANEDIKATVDFIVEHKVGAIFIESTTSPERMEKLKEAVKAKGEDIKVVDKPLYSDSLEELGQPLDNFIDMYKHNVELVVDNLK